MKIYHRGKKYILDFRFKIVELNKSDLKKFPNLQSTINNLKSHLSVSQGLVNKSAYRNIVSTVWVIKGIGVYMNSPGLTFTVPQKYAFRQL